MEVGCGLVGVTATAVALRRHVSSSTVILTKFSARLYALKIHRPMVRKLVILRINYQCL